MDRQVEALSQTLFKDHPLVALGLALVGGFSVASVTLSYLRLIMQTFVLPGTSLKKFGATKGRWAVVTGATDGIGREFALQLGKAGFNIFLASRTTSKLETVAQEIESTCKVQTKIHAIDFSKRDDAAYAALAVALNTLDIGVLVNNVGKSHEMPVYFADASPQELNDIVEVNVNATLKVTQIVLPMMLSKKNGLILNLGSFAGNYPSPMLATYSGSKAFLSTWSQSLAAEYKSKGIMVEYINPYFVVSAMSKIRRANLLAPTPKAYVRATLSKIGVPCGTTASGATASSTPYWTHAIFIWFIATLNMPWIIIGQAHKMHIDIRRRALKKADRLAATKNE